MRRVLFLVILLGMQWLVLGQVDKSDWQGGVPEGCTSVTVGRLASFDGSVITSHTDDSHRTRSWMDIQPPRKYPAGATVKMYKREKDNSQAMPAYGHREIGTIPQVEETFGYINTAYPCMNTRQLGIGESTFGGREELQSDAGLVDCQRLCKLMLERCETAREAIKMADALTKEYGWNDAGECLTIADTKEVWHFEIVGPGKGEVGAVWVAQRVPDDHISVNANASTIRQIDLENPDYFMASDNVFEVAQAKGYWDPAQGPFSFCEAYAPHSRASVAAWRREWRVFDLLAPSLKLNPMAGNYPFSVKPDKKVTLQQLVDLFKDYYEDTPYDMTKDLLVADKEGKAVISPLGNPFMPYDMLEMLRINGGWGALGERTIARWYTMYATIIQCRDWLPDPIGGVVWLAQDNVATSLYVPVYCGVTDVAKPYKTPGRVNGFTRESAWWAFNRLGTLAAQRWGDMRHDVDAVWNPLQAKLFVEQKTVEAEAQRIYETQGTQEVVKFLTDYSTRWEEKVVKRAWRLGDELWTKYDEKF